MKIDNYKLKNRKKAKILIGSMAGIITLGGGYILSRSYGKYQVEQSFPIMEGQIKIRKITVDLSLESCDDTILATTEVTGAVDKYEYQIDSESWKEGSATQNFNVPSRGHHTVKVKVTAGSKTAETSEEIDMPNSETVKIYEKDIPVATCGDGLYKVEHKEEDVDTNWQETEYRFAGVNYTDAETPYVHNYVNFNGEKWRIIGLVNVKTKDEKIEQRLKIVRTDGVKDQKDFGEYLWDNEDENDWTTSKLKTMLNGIYYNSTNGNCYTTSSTATQCDFNSESGTLPKGLSQEARQMVDDGVTWNLGGTANYNTTTVTQYYNYERGETVYNDRPKEWTKTNDEAEHKGVGLIYPSDYGYATNGGNKGRYFCFAEALYNWDTEEECSSNDWLKPSSSYLWTITPYSGGSIYAFSVTSSGFVDNCYNVIYSAVVWPVVYLKSSVKIIDGDGTFQNPYILSVQN